MKLSLEALSLAKKEKFPPRPLHEIVKDYAANPVKLSPELVERLRYLEP